MRHYINTPDDYIDELCMKGKREKARCFFEYHRDMIRGEINSFSFYAKSWSKNKGSVSRWIQEFKHQIELHYTYFELKNKQHYTNVKNAMQPQCNPNATIKQATKPNNTASKNGTETPMQPQCNQVSNITTTQATPPKNQIDIQDVEYYRLQSELRLCNGKYVGKNEDIYEAYLTIKDLIDTKVLLNAYKKYVNKGLENKTVGFKKFIKESYYLPYLPTTLIVNSENNHFKGVYSLKDEILILEDGKRVSFTHSKYIEKLHNREITFL